jgi:glutamate/tyrosine decarboxylase-like PLP-dependent enzyme
MFEEKNLVILEKALTRLAEGFEDLPGRPSGYDKQKMEAVLLELAEKMQDNYPYFHPFYAGQMLKPPHPVARLAYMLSLFVNPNNHALDGGKASSAMEKQAVAAIAGMFGWRRHLGHLTSGGTMANLEALWISGRIKPGLKVAASSQAHYTHQRISDVLGLPFEAIDCDTDARMDINALRKALDSGSVGTVVATMGTTGTGSLDPLPEILELKAEYDFRLHADAAYGGYFILADNLAPHARRCFDQIGEADSIVIDPHKHGLQPYGCGCMLFKDPDVGRFYKHDSPYTYFSSNELHLGEISLECSRPGASAAALWATQKLLPMTPGGEFARGLADGRKAALVLYDRIQSDERFRTFLEPELDILVWAPAGDAAGIISERSQRIFEAAAERQLHLATFSYPSALLKDHWPDVAFDRPDVICLRSCLMKPEHLDWTDVIWEMLVEVTEQCIRRA